MREAWFQYEGPPDIKGIDRTTHKWWQSTGEKTTPTEEELKEAFEKCERTETG